MRQVRCVRFAPAARADGSHHLLVATTDSLSLFSLGFEGPSKKLG